MPDRTDPLSLTTVEFTLSLACGWTELQTLIAVSALNVKLNTDNILSLFGFYSKVTARKNDLTYSPMSPAFCPFVCRYICKYNYFLI